MPALSKANINHSKFQYFYNINKGIGSHANSIHPSLRTPLWDLHEIMPIKRCGGLKVHHRPDHVILDPQFLQFYMGSI